MSQIITTKLSSKGQVVIPEAIRNIMHLHSGDQFLVIAEKDVIILKAIDRPNIDEYKSLIRNIRKVSKKLGLTKNDIDTAIENTRKK